MLQLIFFLAALASTSYASAETIAVKYWGNLNLAPFACTDITRSSFINRACYDNPSLHGVNLARLFRWAFFWIACTAPALQGSAPSVRFLP